MNSNNNVVSIHKLSTGQEVDNTLIRADIYQDRDGRWTGQSTWSFAEKPVAEGDKPSVWQLQLRTVKGLGGIRNYWQVQQDNGGGILTHLIFGDFALRHQPIIAGRASEKGIREAHEAESLKLDEVKAQAVVFYQQKLEERAARARN